MKPRPSHAEIIAMAAQGATNQQIAALCLAIGVPPDKIHPASGHDISRGVR